MTDPLVVSGVADGHLGTLCSSWRDVQQTRLALAQRGMDKAAAAMLKVEESLGREITSELQSHPVYSWLSQYRGLRGVHVGRLIAIIGDPRRFPGHGCEHGHIYVPDYAVGTRCPVLHEDETRCEGTVETRRGSGVRSLWHYLGLHVVNGRMPKRRKGHQADWNGQGRTALLMPEGVADQIIRFRVEPYRSLYDRTKLRLVGPAELADVDEQWNGGAEGSREIDGSGGLAMPLIRAHKIARTVAVKAFVGDLLIAMKAAHGGAATRPENEGVRGLAEAAA